MQQLLQVVHAQKASTLMVQTALNKWRVDTAMLMEDGSLGGAGGMDVVRTFEERLVQCRDQHAEQGLQRRATLRLQDTEAAIPQLTSSTQAHSLSLGADAAASTAAPPSVFNLFSSSVGIRTDVHTAGAIAIASEAEVAHALLVPPLSASSIEEQQQQAEARTDRVRQYVASAAAPATNSLHDLAAAVHGSSSDGGDSKDRCDSSSSNSSHHSHPPRPSFNTVETLLAVALSSEEDAATTMDIDANGVSDTNEARVLANDREEDAAEEIVHLPRRTRTAPSPAAAQQEARGSVVLAAPRRHTGQPVPNAAAANKPHSPQAPSRLKQRRRQRQHVQVSATHASSEDESEFGEESAAAVDENADQALHASYNEGFASLLRRYPHQLQQCAPVDVATAEGLLQASPALPSSLLVNGLPAAASIAACDGTLEQELLAALSTAAPSTTAASYDCKAVMQLHQHASGQIDSEVRTIRLCA
jgi:hypothetical protein